MTPSINSEHNGRYYSPVAPKEKATDPYGNSTALPLLPILGIHPPLNRELKGRQEDHLLLFERVPNFLVLFFSIEILVQVPHLGFCGWLSL